MVIVVPCGHGNVGVARTKTPAEGTVGGKLDGAHERTLRMPGAIIANLLFKGGRNRNVT